jgi:hypothetical protein
MVRPDVSIRANLFIKTKLYNQHFDLTFRNPSLNARFKLEAARLSQPSLRALTLLAAVLSVLVSIAQLSISLLLFSIASCGLAFIDLKPHSFLAAGSCLLLLPQLTLADSYSLSQSVMVFLPTALLHFLHSSSWRYFCQVGAVQLIFISVCSNSSIFTLTMGLAISVVLYSVMERYVVDLWILEDSYKKSSILLWELLDSSKEGTLIVDLEGQVKHYNKAVYAFIQQRCSLLDLDVRNLLPQHLDINSIIQRCKKEGCIQTKVFLTASPKDAINSSQRVLAYNLSAEQASWVGGNCIKITLQDATSKTKQDGLTFKGLMDLQNSYSIMTRELERSFKYEEAIQKEDLKRLRSTAYCVNSILSWQMICLGGIEFNHRLFNVRDQVLEIIDTSASRHLNRLDDIILTFNASFPTGVVGDLNHHGELLKALLGFVLQTVSEDGSIKLYCDVAVSSK